MANKQEKRNKKVGGVAGLGAGILTGARIGTTLIPIPVVGTFAGALIGGVVGSELGRTYGGALLDGINAGLDAFTESISPEGPSGAKPPTDERDTPIQ